MKIFQFTIKPHETYLYLFDRKVCLYKNKQSHSQEGQDIFVLNFFNSIDKKIGGGAELDST